MKNIITKFSAILLLLIVGCSEEKVEGLDYGTVSGRVVKAVTFEPVANAKVFSNPNSSTVFTDEDGKFTMSNVPVGDYSFEAQKDSFNTKFEAVTVNVDSNTEVVFELQLATTNNRPPDTPVLVAPADNAVNLG